MAQLRFAEDAAALLSLIPEESVIIDADCGRGQYSTLFVEAGHTVSAFDALTPLPPTLEATDRFAAVAADIDETLVPFRTVNAVWTNERFLYLSPDALLSRLRLFCDWLVPNGYITMIVREGEGQKIIESQGITGIHRQAVYQYQPAILESIIQAAGFKTIKAWRSGSIESRIIHLIAQKI